MSTSAHPAHVSAKAQRFRWSYLISPIKGSFICTGIWAILAVLFILGLKLYGDYAHPGHSITRSELAVYIGSILGQFALMTLCLWSLVVYRIWKNVSYFILLDWRWWLGLVLLSALLKNPPLAWVWVGLIYQVRLKIKSAR
jgi:hypothetical protein